MIAIHEFFPVELEPKKHFPPSMTASAFTSRARSEGNVWDCSQVPDGLKVIPARIPLSGGTSSSMAVLSLASSPTGAKLGTMLLVDEFGDVGPSMRRKIYSLLTKENQLGCAVFVRLTEGSLRAESIK